MKKKLLIVDDNSQVLNSLKKVLEPNFKIWTANSADAARNFIHQELDIVLLDINLNQSDLDNRAGVDLLSEFLQENPELPIVMISAYGNMRTAVECMQRGAADFIQKPPNMEELSERLNRALEHAQTSKKANQLEERLQQLEPIEIIGKSEAIEEIKHIIGKIAQDRYATVLIQGETGTGKELAARAIHQLGPRSDDPCMAVSIASLNPNLVESELFGHVKGAFAGAHSSRVGFIEKAKGGVLFLDEVGELSMDVQVKLLRFLEERKFFPVGSSSSLEVDIQVVAATNRDLSEEVKSGRFREDLYYRLSVIPINLPPLRERREDIPLLVDHFLALFRKQGRTRIKEVSQEAVEALAKYQWPGNIRQLKNEVERAILQSFIHGYERIEKSCLSPEVLNQPTQNRESFVPQLDEEGISIDQELAKWELCYVQEALKLTNEKKSDAWKLLDLNDRYALTRRVKSALKKFPELAEDFPIIKKLYKKHIPSS